MHNELLQKNIALLKKAGAAEEYCTGAPLTPAQYLAMAGTLRDKKYWYSISAFDSSQEPVTIPRTPHWYWPNFEHTLRLWQTNILINLLPPFWQVESAIESALKRLGVPVYNNQPNNLSLASIAIEQIGINTVLAEVHIAKALSALLKERQKKPPEHWFVIYRPENTVQIKSFDTEHSREVHLFPGLPVLEQCPLLAANQSESLWHLVSNYIVEQQGSQCLITSLGNEPVPLVRVLLPWSIDIQDMCLCGRATVRI